MENEERRDVQQQGIQVIIRIKPRTQEGAEEDYRKCVFLSPTEPNTIVVETQNKKEFFSFDHIASEESQQQQIYDSIGQPVLEESFKGFNCCIFAYGQTGAGKTYSILGDPTQLNDDYYSETRGILPRLLEQLFILSRRSAYKSCDVRCSYLEIYNEQIIDLLNKDIKAYQIREDHRKGVYVEGLSEQRIETYEDSLEIILKGLKNRKIAATSMNSESSRSHTIFSITLHIELQENGIQKTRFSKIHIVDLAGSERTKLAKVEGDRLREGCNINKSLHALGNVINSLVESAKKKKYIPFRDSKLTFFLKDSLGGNSKTKMLANVNPCKAYLGDTISTLMFAKRAKIIKVRVEANENIADNFESLRNEIRKLREELAQTKFIKNQPKQIELDQTMRQRFVDFSMTDLDQTQERVLRVFEENQSHFRVLLNLYKERIVINPSAKVDYGFKNMFGQKKNLQKSCNAYESLIANFPPFTRIFRENLQLKRKSKSDEAVITQFSVKYSEAQIELQALRNNNRILKGQLNDISNENAFLRQQIEEMASNTTNTHSKYSVIHGSHKKDSHASHTYIPSSGENGSSTTIPVPKLEFGRHHLLSPHEQKGALTRRDQLKHIVSKQNEMLEQYQHAVEELKAQMTSQMRELNDAYLQLQKELEMEREYKQSMRRQNNKKKDVPIQLQTLQNENEYLKLNVMELETELSRIEEENFKKQIQLRTVQQEADKFRSQLNKLEKVNEQNGLKEKQLVDLLDKVREIKEAANREQRQIEQQRDTVELQFKELKNTLMIKLKENYELASKNQSLASSNTALRKKLTDILKIESQQSVIMNKESACWTTLQQDNISEDFTLQKTMNTDMAKELDRLTAEKDVLHSRLEDQQKKFQQQRSKLQKASNRILSLTRDLTKVKQDHKHESEELRILQLRIEELESLEKTLRDRYKLLDSDHHRLKKQHQQSELFIQRVREDIGRELPQIIEQYKSLKIRNQVLNQQNERLRSNSTVLYSEGKANIQSNNTKSMRYLPIVRESEVTTPRMNSTQKLEELRQFSTSITTAPRRQEPKRRQSFGTPTPQMLKKIVEVRGPAIKTKQTQKPPTTHSTRQK